MAIRPLTTRGTRSWGAGVPGGGGGVEAQAVIERLKNLGLTPPRTRRFRGRSASQGGNGECYGLAAPAGKAAVEARGDTAGMERPMRRVRSCPTRRSSV